MSDQSRNATEHSTAGNAGTSDTPDSAHGGGKRSGRHKLLVSAVVAGSLVGVALAAHAMGGHGHKGHGAFSGPMKGPMMGILSLVEEVDTDQSGSVSRQEIDMLRNDRFTGNDGDSSGALSLEEFRSLWLEIAHPVMVDHFQFLDHDGDGNVTREEFDRPIDRVVAVLDRNGDGEITLQEVRELHAGRRGGHHAGHHDKDRS